MKSPSLTGTSFCKQNTLVLYKNSVPTIEWSYLLQMDQQYDLDQITEGDSCGKDQVEM